MCAVFLDVRPLKKTTYINSLFVSIRANALQVTLNVTLLTNHFSLGSNDNKRSQKVYHKSKCFYPRDKEAQ